MRILITGGSGFLGREVAAELLRRGSLLGTPITRLVLADLIEPASAYADDRLEVVTGALDDTLPEVFREPVGAVIHLAAAVSGECEADLDLGLRVNLDLTRLVLEHCRRQAEQGGPIARLFFASSVAVYGADAALPMPDVISEATMPLPQSSYGAQKAICERLVADYSRKGLVDGRVARIMTVSVRPGKPNAAASGFLSGIIREPLAGASTRCPVDPALPVALASPRRAVEGILAVLEATRGDQPGKLTGQLPVNLPALTVTVAELLDALERIGGPAARERVTIDPDPAIEAIVASWPSRFDNTRAAGLGLRPDESADAVIKQYVADHPDAIAGR